MPYPVQISKLQFSVLWRAHLDVKNFNSISHYVHGMNGTWADSQKNDDPVSSCAVRLSLALSAAGVRFAPFKNCWKFKRGGDSWWLPSLAADFPGFDWKGKTWGKPILEKGMHLILKDLSEVKGQTGILFFGPGTDVSGHLTLWDGENVHFNEGDNLAHKSKKIIFWKIPNQ